MVPGVRTRHTTGDLPIDCWYIGSDLAQGETTCTACSPRRRPAETRRRLRDDSDVGFHIHVEIHSEMRSQHFEEVARTPPLRERASVTSDALPALHT